MILYFDLDLLRAAEALVDARLERLDRVRRKSPDQFGVFDEEEYITGSGFVACYTYATATMSRIGARQTVGVAGAEKKLRHAAFFSGCLEHTPRRWSTLRDKRLNLGGCSRGGVVLLFKHVEARSKVALNRLRRVLD